MKETQKDRGRESEPEERVNEGHVNVVHSLYTN